MNQYHPISHQNATYDPYQMNYQDKSNQLQQSKGPVFQNGQNPQILGQSQLKHINNQMSVLQRDIQDNNREIRLLNNKITKSDFQHALLKKLFQKEQKLRQKRIEFQDILKTHDYLRKEMINNQMQQSQIKHTLGQQYQKIVEQKKRQQRQQKQRQMQQQSAMISYNQQAIKSDRQRKRQFMERQKRQVQQELRQKQHIRELERQQKEKQKTQYNQVLNHRSQLQTQKDHVYRQYYNHFIEEQEKLQTIYKNKAMEAETKKQKQRQDHEKRQYETFQMRMARENQEKLRKITLERESLKSFLQAQMEENNIRKTRQRQEERRYQSQAKSHQINLNSYQSMEKQKKKDLQRKYDTELSTQIQFKNRVNQQSIQDAYRNSSLNQQQRLENGQYSQRKTHNPVTNPIDFKIGITNPYVIKEYENTKEKYMGDHNLKLRNLAMIGNNSLMSGRH